MRPGWGCEEITIDRQRGTGAQARPRKTTTRPGSSAVPWAPIPGVLVLVALLSVAACGGGGADVEGTDVDGDGGSGRRFSIAASGDVLLHMPVVRSAETADGYDFTPMFEDVREVISAADLAVCHLETPVSATNIDLSGYPLFNAPREIVPALRDAGFDACEATSNHSLDRGFGGVQSTLGLLDRAGIEHTGTGRSAEEQATPPIYDVNGVKVGHLAYTYSYNDAPIPTEAPWLRDLLFPEVGLERVLADAAAVRDRGAEFVVVSMQWGAEYQQTPTAEQKQWAKSLLLSDDVDLILGDHVHVIQPCEQIVGEYVHYGMGNFLSNQSPASGLAPSTQDGVIVTYEMEERSPGVFATTSMSYTPTFVTIPGHRIERATPDRHAESYARTVEAMTALGPGACDASPTTGPGRE